LVNKNRVLHRQVSPNSDAWAAAGHKLICPQGANTL